MHSLGYLPVPIAPDPARDARVAARRAADARKAGRALDQLSDSMLGRNAAYFLGWSAGYAASELHHSGHYGVPAGPLCVHGFIADGQACGEWGCTEPAPRPVPDLPHCPTCGAGPYATNEVLMGHVARAHR